jgi:hypothetical protein
VSLSLKGQFPHFVVLCQIKPEVESRDLGIEGTLDGTDVGAFRTAESLDSLQYGVEIITVHDSEYRGARGC